MKRYHLFAAPFNAPEGGLGDYVGVFDTIEGARANTTNTCYPGWRHIVVADADSGWLETVEEWHVLAGEWRPV